MVKSLVGNWSKRYKVQERVFILMIIIVFMSILSFSLSRSVFDLLCTG